jgi:hypothetical protein
MAAAAAAAAAAAYGTSAGMQSANAFSRDTVIRSVARPSHRRLSH